MGWHLAFHAGVIQGLDILPGSPSLIAVWTGPREVHFLSLDSGDRYGSLTLDSPEFGADDISRWLGSIQSLRAPNGHYLPTLRFNDSQIVHTSYDGRMLAYFDQNSVMVDVDGDRVMLRDNRECPIRATGFDRELGSLGVLADNATLEIYQQHVLVGTYPVDINGGLGQPRLFLPDAAGRLIVGDPGRVRVFDFLGHKLFEALDPARISSVACSPGGEWIAALNMTGKYLMVFNGELVPMFQGDVLDLLDKTRSVQLFPAEVAQEAGARVIAVADDGTIAFAVEGVIGVAAISDLESLPRPTRLL